MKVRGGDYSGLKHPLGGVGTGLEHDVGGSDILITALPTLLPFFEILFIPLIGYHNSSCILSVFEQFLNF